MTNSSDITTPNEGQTTTTESNALAVNEATNTTEAPQRLIYQHLSRGSRSCLQIPTGDAE